MSKRIRVIGWGLFLSLPLVFELFAEQPYVTRFDAYAGYAYLNSPSVNLTENGFHFQAGVRPRTWYSVGFDYSYSTGDLTITPTMLPPALAQQLAAQWAALAAAGRFPRGTRWR